MTYINIEQAIEERFVSLAGQRLRNLRISVAEGGYYMKKILDG